MKPLLVQQKSNGSLWWVVDWKISCALNSYGRGLLPSMHRVYTLIPADDRNGLGSRISHSKYYTFISNSN